MNGPWRGLAEEAHWTVGAVRRKIQTLVSQAKRHYGVHLVRLLEESLSSHRLRKERELQNESRFVLYKADDDGEVGPCHSVDEKECCSGMSGWECMRRILELVEGWRHWPRQLTSTTNFFFWWGCRMQIHPRLRVGSIQEFNIYWGARSPHLLHKSKMRE